MKILIDIGHPAHVHLFRNFYREMKLRSHEIFVTVKDIPSATRLLEIYGIPYTLIGKKRDSIGRKAANQLLYDWRMARFVKENNIEIGIGSSITLAHVSKVTGMKSIIFDDDDDSVEPLFVRYAHPFADCILSPDALKDKRKRSDTVYYAGYHELAYLHPVRFNPDFEVCRNIGIMPGEKYFVLRFNAFKAYHDAGAKGLSMEQKWQLINTLSTYGKLFITTEDETSTEFAQFRMNISRENIHSLLSFATLFVGDSQTMTSEAAVLGTPAIRCNTFASRLSVPEEEEQKYGLTFGFQPTDFKKLISRLNEMLSIYNLKQEWQQRRKRMLHDKIDVTAFMIWFVENYPGSAEIIREKPDYQEVFIST